MLRTRDDSVTDHLTFFLLIMTIQTWPLRAQNVVSSNWGHDAFLFYPTSIIKAIGLMSPDIY
jgi:hypothetical protein